MHHRLEGYISGLRRLKLELYTIKLKMLPQEMRLEKAEGFLGLHRWVCRRADGPHRRLAAKGQGLRDLPKERHGRDLGDDLGFAKLRQQRRKHKSEGCTSLLYE